MNAVTCLQWIQKGAAKTKPDQIKLTEEELTDIVKGMKKTALDDEDDESEDENQSSDLPRKRKLAKSDTAIAAEEDDDSNDTDEESNPLNLAGVTYYANQNDDPFLSKEPDSDDDLEILSSDNLIALGKVNKDDCNLEVYVYNEQDGNCWCHHDYILPTIPLCLEWLDYDPGSENGGNLVAIGSMSPDIELWDLDVLESLEPAFVLAGDPGRKPGKSHKKKKRKSLAKGHADAVLDLAWNRNQRQALASASADYSLGLWDLEQGEMVTSFPHNEKVQTIQWHRSDPYSLLSGCADHTIKLFDCRNLEPDVIEWKVSGEVENVVWDVGNSDCFLASTDKGSVYYFDKRNTSKHLFSFQAHEESVTGMTLSDKIKGCFVTCSSDKSIKMWDLNETLNIKPIMSREINIGQLFCISICPDANLLYAVGGERELKVLNMKKNAAVIEHFGLGDSSKTDEDILVPVEGGMDGDNELEDHEDEVMKAVKKKKKTHRGKKHKNTNDEDTGNTNSATALDSSKEQAQEHSTIENELKKKKKKKKKKSHQENVA